MKVNLPVALKKVFYTNNTRKIYNFKHSAKTTVLHFVVKDYNYRNKGLPSFL